MADCSHNCADCKEKCAEIEYLSLNKNSSAKKIIGVVSGKGGVGKSLVTCLIAETLAKQGYKVGIMDADITGPSIPLAFGLHGMLEGNEEGIEPATTRQGIKVVSVNLLVEDETRPVVYRGPALAGLINQFYERVNYGDLDYLLIDMPPGTADINLTIFQRIPLTGLIMVTTPQELVKLIVAKSINMASLLNVPILGVVENMSYMVCDDCGKKLYPFGKSNIEKLVSDYHLPLLATLPIDPNLQHLVDLGEIDKYDTEELDYLIEKIGL